MEKVWYICLTSDGAASVVSWNPGEGDRGGGCLGNSEAGLVRWNCRGGFDIKFVLLRPKDPLRFFHTIKLVTSLGTQCSLSPNMDKPSP